MSTCSFYRCTDTHPWTTDQRYYSCAAVGFLQGCGVVLHYTDCMALFLTTVIKLANANRQTKPLGL